MAALIIPAMAKAEKPLSAIEWLNDPAAQQQALPQTGLRNDVAKQVITETIQVMELDGPLGNAVGLIPSHVSGIPKTIWRDIDTSTVERRLAQLPIKLLPTAKDLLDRLLLTQADADDAIVLARSERLAASGEVQYAFAMLQQRQITSPVMFDHFFDLALLTDQDSLACDVWKRVQSLSSDPAIGVYCRAILGHWDTAVLNYYTRTTLGDITGVQAELLRGFLDPELVDELTVPPPNLQTLSPFEFRLRDSIGHSVPTAGLPLSFAASDLQPIAGWRAQLDAAERLAHVCSITPAMFRETYMTRTPAASGGVWDRVAAMQILLQAARAQDPHRIGDLLPAFWTSSKQSGLGTVIAKALYPALSDAGLDDSDLESWIEIQALVQPSKLYLTWALNTVSTPQRDAIAAAFDADVETHPITALRLFDALTLTDDVAQGDMARAPDMIRALRQMGLTSEARALIIEAILLGP